MLPSSVEELPDSAPLTISKSTVSRICHELRDRYTAFCNKSLADLNLLALFLDAIYCAPRGAVSPSGLRDPPLAAAAAGRS